MYNRLLTPIWNKPSHGIIMVVGYAIVSLTGCTHPLGPHVMWRDVGDAVFKAATSPWVLGPAVGGLVLHIDDWDEQIAAWAVDHTPVFGSPERAEEASDTLRDAAVITAGVAAVVTPTGPDGAYAWVDKVWELSLGAAALETTRWTTKALKDVTRAHLNKRNFPSAHTSRSAVGSTLALGYVDYYAFPAWGRKALQGAFITLPSVTGWARVEAGAHVPSDVLAGLAVGNFFGLFVHALFKARTPVPVSVTVIPWEDGAMVRVGVRY